MGRELDARVARAMGLRVKHWRDETDGGTNLVDQDGEYFGPWSDYDPHPKWRWSPSTDHTAAHTMEDWIEEHHPELRDDYAVALYGATCHVWQGGVCKGWAMAHASPEQRCRAFLAAVDNQEGHNL